MHSKEDCVYWRSEDEVNDPLLYLRGSQLAENRKTRWTSKNLSPVTRSPRSCISASSPASCCSRKVWPVPARRRGLPRTAWVDDRLEHGASWRLRPHHCGIPCAHDVDAGARLSGKQAQLRDLSQGVEAGIDPSGFVTGCQFPLQKLFLPIAAGRQEKQNVEQRIVTKPAFTIVGLPFTGCISAAPYKNGNENNACGSSGIGWAVWGKNYPAILTAMKASRVCVVRPRGAPSGITRVAPACTAKTSSPTAICPAPSRK
jgi:hypothetical protein